MVVAIGVCLGKAAIIRPRAPPRDDELQSIQCDTEHSAKLLGNDAPGNEKHFAATYGLLLGVVSSCILAPKNHLA